MFDTPRFTIKSTATVAALMLFAGSVLLLAGCYGQPQKSPARELGETPAKSQPEDGTAADDE